jgi:DNA-directed RNA polymerase specialized sigma24 family protein
MPYESERSHSAGTFPVTHISVVAALASKHRDERDRAFDRVVAAYWKPVYKYIRIKYRLPVEDAQDYTQSFFTTVLEKSFLSDYDSSRARFRTYLRICLDRFVANQRRDAGRLKRGGDATHLSLDFENAEDELQTAPLADKSSIDTYFENEWVRSLFEMSVEVLHKHCCEIGKEIQFELFRLYDLRDQPTEDQLNYEELARKFGIAVTDVTNYLTWARREFRRTVLRIIRELTTSEQEFREEVRAVLGVKAE